MKKIGAILFFLILSGCQSDENTIGQTGYETPEVSKIAMYEINIGAFSDSHNLNGITQKLGYLEQLGINTIWLMPIYRTGVENAFGSPYCVRDFTEVNPSLGNLQDLKNLVDAAHERGIAVLLDWVANHTSWDNAWITEHPDWYTHDEFGNIIHPAGTNWTDVADLNYDRAEMRQEMIESMKFWIDTTGIDGFRCDAADMIPAFFWNDAISQLRASSARRLIFLAEGERPDHYASGFDMTFDWHLLSVMRSVFTNADSNPAALFNIGSTNESLFHKLRFTTNHDESNHATPIEDFGSVDAALSASVFAICSGGVPLLYSGQEVGVADPAIYSNGGSIDWTAHPEMFDTYQKLLALYEDSEAVRNGAFNPVASPSADIVKFIRFYNGEQVFVSINLKPVPKSLSLVSSMQGDWLDVIREENVSIGETIELPAHGFRVLRRQ